MSSPVDLEELFTLLHQRLVRLAEVLLHAQIDSEIKQAFRDAGKAALILFRDEELEMERTACPALALNRAGHQKFMQKLSNLSAQVIAERSGVRASGDLRRDLLPWLMEHHAVVDRQLVHHIKRTTSIRVEDIA